MAAFFGARSEIIDPDSLLTHANGATALDEVWVEGGDALGGLLSELGAVHCGDVERDALRGKRFGLANGEVVVVPRPAGRRPRLLGARLSGVAGETAWIR
jgi:hypothetical protein